MVKSNRQLCMLRHAYYKAGYIIVILKEEKFLFLIEKEYSLKN